MRLYLIGMPGCGKSTLGKALAKKLGYEFIDMDSFIEQKACMYIDEIFDAYGEEYFRDLETFTLDDFLKMDNVIIATGGGVIKNKNNKNHMDGKIIYLDVPLDLVEERLNNSDIVRPLLKTKTVKDLYEERKDLYEYFKDIKVLNTNLDVAIDSIIKELNI